LVFGGISIAIWLIWGKKSLKTLKSGGSDTTAQKSRLGRHERKLRHQARELYKAGKFQAAAQVLESIGMIKNAVSILEEQGKVHEACKILLRHGHVETAAVIYARNKLWDNAAESFEKAEKLVEAAQCFREGGNFSQAAELFSKLKNYQAAARCFADAGDLRKAGESFIRLKKVGQAIPLYQTLYKKDPEAFLKIRFSSEESRAFRSWLKKEKGDLYLAKALGARGKLRPLLLDMAKEGKVKTGTEIFKMVQGPHKDKELAPKLVSEVSYETDQAKNMAEIFQGGEDYYYAGVIYEKLEEFIHAAKAYEKAGDKDRAANCFERGGGVSSVEEQAGPEEKPPVPEFRAGDVDSSPPRDSDPGKKISSSDKTETGAKKSSTGPAAGVFSLGEVSEVYTPENSPGPEVTPEPVLTEPENSEKPPRDDGSDPDPAPSSGGEFRIEKGIEPEVAFSLGSDSPPSGAPLKIKLPDIAPSSDPGSVSLTDTADTGPEPVNLAGKGPEEGGTAEDSGDAVLKLQFTRPSGTGSGSGLTPAELNFSESSESAEETLIDHTINMQLDLSSITEEDREIFFRVKIFDNLTQEQKNRILALAEIEELLKEDILMLSRQNGSGLYVLLRGCLASNGGSTVQLEKNRESGDSLGEAFVFSDINIPETFLAKEDSLICHIASDSIDQLLRDDPKMARQLYKNYTNHLLRRMSGRDKAVNIQDDS